LVKTSLIIHFLFFNERAGETSPARTKQKYLGSITPSNNPKKKAPSFQAPSKPALLRNRCGRGPVKNKSFLPANLPGRRPERNKINFPVCLHKKNLLFQQKIKKQPMNG